MIYIGAQVQMFGKSNRKMKSSDELMKDVMSNNLIRAFMREHPDLPQSVYKKSLPNLFQFVREQRNCSQCRRLESCQNRQPGFCLELVAGETYIDVRSKKCPKLEAFEETKKRSSLMKTFRIPKGVRKATFETIDFDPDRLPVIESAMEYCTLFGDGLPKYGLYLHGSFGVGKTHISASIANFLSGIGVDSFLVYCPDFVQEVYNSIRNGNTSELVDTVKRVKVLIFDDIGAENLTPWIRDEVLGSILQHRMAEELPTIYTSNLTPDELEEHFSQTVKGGVERLKAARLMERIRPFVKPLEVRGRNRRECV